MGLPSSSLRVRPAPHRSCVGHARCRHIKVVGTWGTGRAACAVRVWRSRVWNRVRGGTGAACWCGAVGHVLYRVANWWPCGARARARLKFVCECDQSLPCTGAIVSSGGRVATRDCPGRGPSRRAAGGKSKGGSAEHGVGTPEQPPRRRWARARRARVRKWQGMSAACGAGGQV